MLRSVPWDVWAAGALAVAVLVAAIFEPWPVVLVAIYLALCAYIVFATFTSKLSS